MAKPKFYAVGVGREGPKIYTNWDDCKANTTRFPGAKHKSFTTRSEAEAWIAEYVSIQPPQGLNPDSDIEIVEGPSTTTGSSTRLSAKRKDSDSEIEFIAHVPAKKPTMDTRTPQPEPQELNGPLKSEPSITLSPEQAKVLGLVKNRSNVFFTGSAGTGKSVLLQEIIRWLKESRKTVAITASTGIAGINIGGTTLHSWAGIGLGRESAEEIAVKFFANAKRYRDADGDYSRPSATSKRFKETLQRWRETDVLIIDEISMLDGKLFDTLEELAGIIRKPKDGTPFGGIQLVLSGDFCQLPPVPDRNDKGVDIPATFAFEAGSWERCVGPPVVLQKVFRQKDQAFVDILSSMRFGNLLPSSAAALHGLSRPVSYNDGIEPTELYPTRREVDRANNTRLNGLKTEDKTYESSDWCGTDADGKPRPWATAMKLLERLVVPSKLTVKVGAQVMLVKNLHNHNLVNGSIGKVERFMTAPDAEKEGIAIGLPRGEDDKASIQGIPKKISWPVVRFTTGKCLLCVNLEFSVNDASGKPEVSRNQVPLILAWALSVHKSQGQTLERVKVDLRRTFEDGQAYVALSRATKMEQLQVLNFNESKVHAHPRVIAWYQKFTPTLYNNARHTADEEISNSVNPAFGDDMDEMDSEMAMDAYYG